MISARRDPGEPELPQPDPDPDVPSFDPTPQPSEPGPDVFNPADPDIQPPARE